MKNPATEMKELIVFRTHKDINLFFRSFGKQYLMKKNIMVLACSLRAQAILLQQGVQYQTTLPYFAARGMKVV